MVLKRVSKQNSQPTNVKELKTIDLVHRFRPKYFYCPTYGCHHRLSLQGSWILTEVDPFDESDVHEDDSIIIQYLTLRIQETEEQILKSPPHSRQ